MTRRKRIVLWLAWLLLLAILAAGLVSRLHVSTDLRSFMPPARTPDQKLLMEGIGEGPGSRVLMLAIHGADATRLAALSRGLSTALKADPQFSEVANGDFGLSDLDPQLLPYRYLLSPGLDGKTLDAAFLQQQLQERLQDLASPAASLIKPLLARDPTLEVASLAEQWSPPNPPPTFDGVWMSGDCGGGAAEDAAGKADATCQALLLVQTRAAGFDPGGQSEAQQDLRQHFANLPHADGAQLDFSGPGYFTVEVSQRTRAEANWFGRLDTIGFVLLLLLAYRSFSALGLVALPVLSAGVCGAAALALVFGEAHGITLAFGFTLLGVVQEYPIRVLSHRRAGVTPVAGVLELWPLLKTAIASACIAYLAFFASGVAGLQQLALFTICGLLAAAVVTRFVLPHLLPPRFVDSADSRIIGRLWDGLRALPRPRWLPWLVLAAALVMLALAPGPFWQNNLAGLTPVPKPLLQRDMALRAHLGAPDVRYLLVLEAGSADGVLALSERLKPELDKRVSSGAVDAIELPSRYLPSVATQKARQSRLPDRARLEAALAQAGKDLPFRGGLFQPFVDDVETARKLEPMTPAKFVKTPLGTRLATMLVKRDGHWLGLATLSGMHDPEAFAGLANTTGGKARLLDLKQASESLVVAYRQRILWALGGAFVLLALTVLLAFRNVRRAWHVLAPMTLATILMIAVERISGISLSLFHLVAVTLAAGLGLHYALFFERPVDDQAEARRTLHATLVCVLSAVLVFGLMAFSSLPVLRGIGLTVSLGVGFHFCLSLLMARKREGAS